MHRTLDRRRFLTAAGSLALLSGPALAVERRPGERFSFALLGDLHLDRLEHHDMEWLRREKPNDVRQVEDYSRITREVMPGLFAEVKEQLAARQGAVFTVHVGDLVEGLCGTPELARVHCRDAVTLVRETKLGTPFLFCKGNHDVTGPGSVEAFDQVLLPFLSDGAGKELRTSCYTVERGDALFVYYDAYRRDSLDWLEKTLEGRRARHLFFVIHPPVVPFGARSTWHVFARPEQREQRERLLRVLGRHRAIVLCGHLHKFGTVVRKTEEGPFVQLMVSSILSRPAVEPRDQVSGVDRYGPDLVNLEPSFQPESVPQRREMLSAERPFVRQFEYANAPGYAMVEVDGGTVRANVYCGLGKRLWKPLDLSGLLNA
jgi:UDP-2,3-diacylglucosamine pyrophosphatase LpxH